jgi:hypothetical protein
MIMLAKIILSAIFLATLFIAKSPGHAENAGANKDNSVPSAVQLQSLRVELDAPIVAALSGPNEKRWGFHQFPWVQRLPDGRLLLGWLDTHDASESHGRPSPALVSGDGGRTWEEFRETPRPTCPHYSVSEIFNGEYLVVPAQPYLNYMKAVLDLPEPVAVADIYGKRYSYRVRDLPPRLRQYYRQLPAYRWTPALQRWTDETVEYDLDRMLFNRREGSEVLPRTFNERSLLKHGRELMYADYRVGYEQEDGTVPKKNGSHLMVSTDNGKTFRRRATIAVDLSGNDLYGEPQLAHTADGRLVCLLRKTDQQQKPMAICWSSDGGQIWTRPRELGRFGVWPCVTLLRCGVLVLSYGRPGVHMRFDAKGAGEDWSEPVSLIKGDPHKIQEATCGYTCLLPLDDSSFLIAYSDFLHRDADGLQRKAILVRRIKVSR